MNFDSIFLWLQNNIDEWCYDVRKLKIPGSLFIFLATAFEFVYLIITLIFNKVTVKLRAEARLD